VPVFTQPYLLYARGNVGGVDVTPHLEATPAVTEWYPK
jgi:hypothetical protein